nr:hypothetical protein [Lachnospiraceae bacterium]
MARSGQWIKAIHFKFPISYHGEIVENIELDENGHIFRPNQSTDEAIALLSKLSEVKHHIEVTVDMDELDLTSAESLATYDEIREWVQEKYGFHVTNLNIAQVKRKLGFDMRANFNLPKCENSRQPNCPEEKEKAIEEALKHFQMI